MRVMRLRAFIAAPLLGTLIFLAAIILVVHMTQVEKAEVQGIVSDIYHNRVTSMLEDYRYDMGALFTVSLSKAIEKFLSSQCWTTFTLHNSNIALAQEQLTDVAPGSFPLGPDGLPQTISYDNLDFCQNTPRYATGGTSCDKSPSPTTDICKEQCNGQLDYHELRFEKCAGITEILGNGICPYDAKYGFTAWLKAIKDETVTNARGGKQGFRFEGVDFSLSNPNQVDKLISTSTCITSQGTLTRKGSQFDYDDNNNGARGAGCHSLPGCTLDDGVTHCDAFGHGTVELGSDIKYCKQLIHQSLFDCRNFAENDAHPFRCCDRFYYNKNNPSDPKNGVCCTAGLGSSGAAAANVQCDGADHVIEGCEEGSFYVNVNVLANDAVFQSLPRVSAVDKAGNQIQSGALGDRDFLVHIKYPFFKYLDAAFRTYAPIAYGVKGNINDFLDPKQNMVLLSPGNRRPDPGKQGVIQGVCYGAGCDIAQPGSRGSKQFKGGHTTAADGQVNGAPNNPAAETFAKDDFIKTFFLPSSTPRTDVCRLFDPAYQSAGQPNPFCGSDFKLCQMTVKISGSGLAAQTTLCSTPAPALAALRTSLQPLALFSSTGVATSRSVSLDYLELQIQFQDSTPEALVSPNANTFCWYLRPQHVNPEVKIGSAADTNPAGGGGGLLPCTSNQVCRTGGRDTCICAGRCEIDTSPSGGGQFICHT